MSPEKNSLAKWAEYGWLKAEPTSAEEIRDLLGIVNRDLADASVEAISDDRRFEAAFSAARTAANIALRSSAIAPQRNRDITRRPSNPWNSPSRPILN